MFLVLLETSGNQNYIFSTNKLKENVGASELTYRAGTKWVLESVGDINKAEALKVWRDSDRLRSNLTNEALNPPIEKSNKPVEIIIAASGKSLLIARDKDTAKEIITKVTTTALKEAPGIDVCGVFVDFEWNKPGSLATAIKEIYEKFEEVYARFPSPSLRFLRLPIVDECSTSGFPASQLEITPEDQKVPLSTVSDQKQQHLSPSLSRMNQILQGTGKQFAENVHQLEKRFNDLEWLAVVHADGNGLGQIFLNFEEYLEDKKSNREYINKLRQFSIALDICTEKAFLSAINTSEENARILPIVPLVLGGDDLTIICDGKLALNFTQKFLQAFEAETAKEHQQGIIPTIAQKALQTNHLSACAGVAIIKPHFPFSVAYTLAEQLIKQAKTVKKKVTQKDDPKQPFPCSAIDFHILYDSSGVDLDPIRQRLIVDNQQSKDNEKSNEEYQKTLLHKRPYVITPLENLKDVHNKDWAEFHHWDRFSQQVKILQQKTEDGKTLLPTSQINDLAATAFQGRNATDGKYQLINKRYAQLRQLEETKSSLFAKDPGEDIYVTGLLDALDAVDFLLVEEDKA